jgi:hypothetical protein
MQPGHLSAVPVARSTVQGTVVHGERGLRASRLIFGLKRYRSSRFTSCFVWLQNTVFAERERNK